MSDNTDRISDAVIDIQLLVQAIRAMVAAGAPSDLTKERMDLLVQKQDALGVMLRSIRDQTEPKTTIVVEIFNERYELTTLDRHILYTIDEGRSVSTKYERSDVAYAMTVLSASGLVFETQTEPKPMALTARGLQVVKLLRDRPR